MEITSRKQSASYWQAMTVPFPLSAEVPDKADLVIIGGGILGVATCYWCTKLGYAPVLLEREALASGATGRNGGFVSLGPAEGYSDAAARLGQETAHLVLNETLTNRRLLQQILMEEQMDCDYHQPGSIHLAVTQQQWDHLAQEACILCNQQLEATMLDRGQLQAMIKTPLSKHVLGGRFFAEDALIHPLKLTQQLAGASQRKGAHLSQGTVTRLEAAREGVYLHTTHGKIHAKKALVATNAWIGELCPSFARQVIPVRGQMLATAPLSSIFPIGMAASLTATGEYWHQRTDGVILLGGCRALASGADMNVSQSEPTSDVQMGLEALFLQLFPQVGTLQVRHRWAGLMAFTSDFLPIVERVADMPDVWVAGGFSGHGMALSIRFGQLLAQALIAEEPPASLSHFGLHRPTLHEEKEASME